MTTDFITITLNRKEAEHILSLCKDKKVRDQLRSALDQLQEGVDKLRELVARQNSRGFMQPDPTEKERAQIAEREARRKAQRQKLIDKIKKMPAEQRDQLVKQLRGHV